jgi:hypothetical protein
MRMNVSEYTFIYFPNFHPDLDAPTLVLKDIRLES